MLLWIRRIGFEILIWAIYLCVAIAFTYPLIFHMSDHLPGAGADAVQYYWFAWWDGLSIFSSHFSPFYCPLVLYPQGAHLNAEPLPFGLVYGILSHALPPILAYNLLYLLLYAFSAWGGYKLSLYLWNSRKVALFTGVVFGFSPFMTFHGIGHVNMLNGGFVALMVLASLKAMDLSRFHPGKVLVAGIFLGLAGLSSSYYFIYSSIWLIGLFVYLLLKRHGIAYVWRVAGIFAVAVLMMTPQLMAMFRGIRSGYYRDASTLGSAYMSSIDLLGVFLPSRLHPIWGAWIAKTFRFMGADSVEKIAYIGFIIIILAIVGWTKYRHIAWTMWLGIWTLGAWIFSLGPILQAFGRITFIPMPGMAFVVLPVLNNARNACRWTVLVTLGMGLLAAGGLKWLMESGKLKRFLKWAWIPAILVVLLEYLSFPYPLIPVTMPKSASQLEVDPAHPAVLNLPVGRADGLGGIGEFDANSLMLQTVHGKPIIGGYLTRMRALDRAVLEEGVLSNIVLLQSNQLESHPADGRSQKIRNMIKKWAKENHPLYKVVQLIAGKDRITKIISPAPPAAVQKMEIVDSQSARTQFDDLGIGYIIAIHPSRPQVRAGLDYLSGLLDLTSLGSKGEYAFYRVNYFPSPQYQISSEENNTGKTH